MHLPRNSNLYTETRLAEYQRSLMNMIHAFLGDLTTLLIIPNLEDLHPLLKWKWPLSVSNATKQSIQIAFLPS